MRIELFLPPSNSVILAERDQDTIPRVLNSTKLFNRMSTQICLFQMMFVRRTLLTRVGLRPLSNVCLPSKNGRWMKSRVLLLLTQSGHRDMANFHRFLL
jgi:hypothetical protein